jgi:hypothetical protein
MSEEIVGSEEWSARVRSKARKLARVIETGYMGLAELLYAIDAIPVDGDQNKGAIYVQWGYDSFGEYVEQELNVQRRRAERLKTIWRRVQVELADMDESLRRRLIDLGWSKVRELVRVINLENAEKWIETAEGMNYQRVALAVKMALSKTEEEDSDGADPPEDVEKLKVINFHLFPEQQDIVVQALERASQLSGSEKKGHNISLVCMDFLANNDFKLANDPQARLKYIAKLEDLMGIRLVMVDPSDDYKIVYGLGTLREVAKFNRK